MLFKKTKKHKNDTIERERPGGRYLSNISSSTKIKSRIKQILVNPVAVQRNILFCKTLFNLLFITFKI